MKGADGAWLFHLPYTSRTASRRTIFYLFHLLLGKISALTSLSTPLVLSSGAAGVSLRSCWRCSIASSRCSRVCAPVRRMAFLLVIFSGGLGWLLLLDWDSRIGWTARRSI